MALILVPKRSEQNSLQFELLLHRFPDIKFLQPTPTYTRDPTHVSNISLGQEFIFNGWTNSVSSCFSLAKKNKKMGTKMVVAASNILRGQLYVPPYYPGPIFPRVYVPQDQSPLFQALYSPRSVFPPFRWQQTK